jgi:hypothetical protein
MANTQLQGQVFNRDGTNYLVLDDNDWSADTLRVKSVDARRLVSEMTLESIMECVFQASNQPATSPT